MLSNHFDRTTEHQGPLRTPLLHRPFSLNPLNNNSVSGSAVSSRVRRRRHLISQDTKRLALLHTVHAHPGGEPMRVFRCETTDVWR